MTGENFSQKVVSRKEVLGLKEKMMAKRTGLEILADRLTEIFGTVTFLLLNAIWFVVWILLNLDIFKAIPSFDPFPYGLLTMLVSLESIFLSVIVLISQNRAAKLEQLRQETDLQLNTISEQEITKIMEMLSKIMEHHRLKTSNDPVLKEMLKPTNLEKIEKDLDQELDSK